MKRKILLVYVLTAFVLLCTNVYAMVTAELNLVADKQAIKPGEDVVVTVELKNLSSAVSSIEGYINIDENILESISSDMVVSNNDGKIEVKTNGEVTSSLSYVFNPSISDADYDVIFNSNDSATYGNDVFFVMDFKKDVTGDSEILKLKYKVKEGTRDADIADAVELDCVVAYSDASKDKSGELSADLDIKVSSVIENNENENVDNTENNTNVDNTNTNNTNTNTNNTNTNNTNTNTNNTNTNTNTNNTNKNNTNTNTNNTNKTTNTNKIANKVDNTVSGTKIPAAGLRTVIIPIIIFMILAYVSYIKYISYKEA